MQRILWITVGALLIVGVIGYFLLGRITKAPPPQPPIPVDTTVNTPQISKESQDYIDKMSEIEEVNVEKKAKTRNDIEIANTAIATLNPNLCDEIESEATKILCKNRSYEALAYKEKNISHCEDIQDESAKKSCIDKVYFGQALEKSDLNICDMIGENGLRAECTTQIEKNLFRLSQSNQTNSGNTGGNCGQYSSSGVLEECKKEIAVKEDYALFSDAMKEKKTSLCDGIRDQKLQNDCYDGIHFLDAKESLSMADCDKIQNESIKSQCVKSLSSLFDSENLKEALKNQNVTLCEKIVSPTIQQTCTDRIRFNNIMQSKNIDDCSLIVDVALQEACKKTLGTN